MPLPSPLPPPLPLPLPTAAIDIGTNSIHLVVARPDGRGGFDVLTSEKEVVRLGSGEDLKNLAPDAIDRGIACLTRMAKVARSFGDVTFAAVATSAVREADNGDEFVSRARDEVGIEIEVISGFEEARLIHLGILQALDVYDRRLLAVDVGGGSTEFVVGEGPTVLEARSLKLGAIRLTERFFPGGTIEPDQVQACRAFVRGALAPLVWELTGHSPQVFVGSSGTITNLAVMAARARGEEVHQENALRFSAAELEEVVERVIAAEPGTRAKTIAGLDEKREDIIVGGAILVSEIFRSLEIDEMIISDYALREGVLLDRMPSVAGSGLERLSHLRRSNVDKLVSSLDPDPAHAEQTAKLALQLFDRTTDLHGYGPAERELLEVSSLLHNIGISISHSGHHKHSYYIIRNSEHLTGFVNREIELIANIARYHRKARPSDKHLPFRSLSSDDQQMVSVLAGFLRVAIGLDRRHLGAVRALRVASRGDELVIGPVPAEGFDLEVEVYGARERSQLLARSLGRKVKIQEPTVIESETLSS